MYFQRSAMWVKYIAKIYGRHVVRIHGWARIARDPLLGEWGRAPARQVCSGGWPAAGALFDDPQGGVRG